MKRVLKPLVIFFIISSIVFVSSAESSDLEGISFQGMDGKMHNFSEFTGGKYLFIDTFATWCGPCKEAAPHIQDMIDYRGDVVEVISLSVSPSTDSLSSVKGFAESAGFTWTVGIDTTEMFQASFPSKNLPGYFIFAPNGTLVYTFGIEEASSSRDYIDIVDTHIPNTHSDYPTEDSGFSNIMQIFWLSLFIGFLTSLSPCLFPMMPTYFTIVARDNKTSRPKLLLSVLILGAGVMLVFSIFGLIYNVTLGSFLIKNYATFLLVQGLVLFLAGLFLIKTPQFILNITLPSKLNDLMYSERVQSNTYLLSFIVGLFYTIIAAPCAFSYFLWEWSLVLAETIFTKILAFGLYTIGAILPFLVIAGFFTEIKSQFAKRVQQGSNLAKYIFGIILIGIGVYLTLSSRGFTFFF